MAQDVERLQAEALGIAGQPGNSGMFVGPAIERKTPARETSQTKQPGVSSNSKAKRAKARKAIDQDRVKALALTGLALGSALWVVGLFGVFTFFWNILDAGKWPFYFQVPLGLGILWAYWMVSKSETLTLKMLLNPEEWRENAVMLAIGLFFAGVCFMCTYWGVSAWVEGRTLPKIGNMQIVFPKGSQLTFWVGVSLAAIVEFCAEPIIVNCWSRKDG